MKLKDILNESKLNEEYVEIIDPAVVEKCLSDIAKAWKEWKTGPLTKPNDIKPAQKEMKALIDRWFKQNIK